MSTKKYILAMILFSQTYFANAETCLQVEGLSFEKISYNKLLVIKGGRNYATLNTYSSIPDKISNFRFFSEKLCDCACPESGFHIDGKLYNIDRIEFFSK